MFLIIRFIAVLSFAFLPVFEAVGAEKQSKRAILKAVNAIRVQHRLPRLVLHPSLQKAAYQQSVLMARAGRMAHKVSRGQGFSARLKRVGYRGLAAENIARGQSTLQRVLSGWMKSPGHRRNMLHPRMRYFGLSAVKGGGRNYWAMVLGG